MKTFGYKTGFVTLNGPIRIAFELEYPLAANWCLAGREFNKVPSVIADKTG